MIFVESFTHKHTDKEVSEIKSLIEVPVSKKVLLSVREATEFFGMRKNNIRRLTNDINCPYVVWIYGDRYIKREKFEQYLNTLFAI